MNFKFGRRRTALPSLLLALSLSLGGISLSHAASYYEDALQRFDAKDYEGAVIQLKNALKKEPNKLAIQFLMGKALQKTGDALGAEVAFNEAIKMGISRSEIVIPLGQTLLAQGRHRDMLLHPQLQPQGLPPETQQALILLRASAQSDMGDHRSALETIATARAINERSPTSWLAESAVRIRTRQFNEALQTADKGVTLAPNEAEGHYVKGSVFHAQGLPDQAMANYGRALSLDPMHVEALVATAGIQLDRRQKAEASKTLELLKKAAPDEPRGAYMRSLLAELNGQPDQVKAALTEVTNLLDPVPPGFVQYRPQLLMLNGLAHYGLGEMSKARQYLESLNKLQPNTPVVRLLARIQLNDNSPATAAPLLENYLRYFPDDGMAMTLLGSAYLAQGKTAKATQVLQEAIKKQDKAETRTALGISLLRGGNPTAAMAELDTAWRKDPSQVMAGMTLAQLHMEQKRYPQALTVTRDLIKRNPTHAGLQVMLGDILYRSNQYPAARQAYEKAIQLDPKATTALLQLIRLDIAANRLDAAQSALSNLLREQPKNSEALAEQSRVSAHQGKPDDALRWLTKAREVSSKSDLRWNLALVELHLQKGRLQQAQEEIKLALEKQPDNLATLMLQARIELIAGNAMAARGTLTNATRIAAYDAAAQTSIAQLQLNAGNVQGAAYSLSKALTEHPDHLPARVLMAKVEQLQGTPDKAEQRAKQIAQEHPKDAVAASLQGDLAVARGNIPLAIQFYRQARTLDNNGSNTLALMRALAAQNQVAEALDIGRQRLRLAPSDAPVQLTVADLLARSGRLADAITAYNALLKTEPLNAEAMNNLANAHLQLKDMKSARQVAEKAQKVAPNNPLVVDTLGWVMFLQGQTEQALPLLRDARLRAPGNPEVRYHLAKVLWASRRKSEARDEAREALRLSTKFDGAADAQAIANATQ